MRQARQQQHHLLSFPPALSAGDQAQGLFVLAAGHHHTSGRAHGPGIVLAPAPGGQPCGHAPGTTPVLLLTTDRGAQGSPALATPFRAPITLSPRRLPFAAAHARRQGRVHRKASTWLLGRWGGRAGLARWCPRVLFWY